MLVRQSSQEYFKPRTPLTQFNPRCSETSIEQQVTINERSPSLPTRVELCTNPLPWRTQTLRQRLNRETPLGALELSTSA